VSLLVAPDSREQAQAVRFVDVFRRPAGRTGGWRGEASLQDLRAVLGRFLGSDRAAALLEEFAAKKGLRADALRADAALVEFAETQLAGAIGSASARAAMASLAKEEGLRIDEVMSILDETSQVLAYSRELERKRQELEAATAELRAANERLRDLDRMKDDFVSTVSHELRTPLTSIRAFAEILHDSPDLAAAKRQEFVGIILRETERLTRLINQILDLAKIESGRAEWAAEPVDLRGVIRDATESTAALYRERGVQLDAQVPERVPIVVADRDRLQQVLLNLLANAVKFCAPGSGRVRIALSAAADAVRVDVADNGIGIAPEHQGAIFEKFRQVGDTLTDRPQGTGLGLPISRLIVRQFGGELWVASEPGRGATFSFTIPVAQGGGRR
jgi:signal transduction histidine kinase